MGYHSAMNPLTGEFKWKVPITGHSERGQRARHRRRAALHRAADGEFMALDEDTGETLWQFKTGSSINAPAITYTHKGQQYVTVQSGLGGSVVSRFVGDKVPRGSAVWTFALMP